MLRDLRFAVRRLARSPGFGATVIALLALTIGANATLFSVLYGLLYKPLPFAGAERIVTLNTRMANIGFDMGLSVPYFDAIARDARTVEGVAGYRDQQLRTGEDGADAASYQAAFVQPGIFTLLGTRPALGRLVGADDAAASPVSAQGERRKPGRLAAATRNGLISWNLWQTRYAGSHEVVGQTLKTAAGDVRIVGVLPRDFGFPHATTQLWLPLQISQAQRAASQAGSFGDLGVLARLRAGATTAAADAELASIARHLDGLKEIVDLVGLKVATKPLRSLWLGERRPALELMLLAVGLVLLVAMANLCNLYIARLLARRQELALLDALGATPWRRLRQTLGEAAMLCLAGAAAGLALVPPGLALLRRFDLVPADAPQAIGLDAATIGFVLALASALAAVLTASANSLQSRDPAAAIRAGGARHTASRGAQRARNGLIVAQIAVTAALLVGVGLLLRSSQRLLAEDVGFDRDGLAISQIADLPPHPGGVAPDPAAAAAAQAALREFLARARALPGVSAVSVGSVAPFGWSMSVGNFALPGEPGEDPAKRLSANRAYVDAEYFDALGARVLRGRTFTADETRSRAAVAVVDDRFARQVFPGSDALGRKFLMSIDDSSAMRELTIVGVIDVVKLQTLDEAAQRPTVYHPEAFPLNIDGDGAMLLVRTHADPAALAAPLRQLFKAAAPQARLRDVVAMRERIAETLRDRQRLNTLLELLGAMALTLAAVGLYAVLAYSVRLRTAEFGVRMALGAPAHRVLALVLSHGLRLFGTGLLLALPLAWLLGRLLGARLYRIGAFDPATLAAVGMLLALISLLACWLPARRAARVDPTEALRHE